MFQKYLARTCFGALLSLGFAMHAAAGISVGGTRVVYDGTKREASVSIRNIGTSPYVVQTWIDSGTDRSAGEKMPLVVTPPLSRLDGGKENILRIVRGAGVLPEDRESVFWLNVKEIPTTSGKENVLQFALRTRIKIFYRPAKMSRFKGGALAAPAALQWALIPAANGIGKALQITNPTPYHVTFSSLTVKKLTKPEIDIDMVPPSGDLIVPLVSAHDTLDGPLHISFSTINEYGASSDPEDITIGVNNTQGAAQ